MSNAFYASDANITSNTCEASTGSMCCLCDAFLFFFLSCHCCFEQGCLSWVSDPFFSFWKLFSPHRTSVFTSLFRLGPQLNLCLHFSLLSFEQTHLYQGAEKGIKGQKVETYFLFIWSSIHVFDLHFCSCVSKKISKHI